MGRMTAAVDLTGTWVPIVTPLTEDDRVDVDALARLADRLLADGVTGLVALGTTGEPATLDERERAVVVATCADVCRRHGRPLIVGAGTNSTRASVAAVEALAGTPALVAALVVVPYYTRPSEAGVVAHLRAIAAASPVPIVVYNIPYRTGRGLGADSLFELAATPGVAGVKQAVGALDRDTLDVLARRPASFHVLAGDDAFIAPSVLMGASGTIAAAAHVCAAAFVAMVGAALAGRAGDARRLAGRLGPVVDAGFAEPNPALWKAALHARGELTSPALRLPLTRATPAATSALLQAVAAAEHETCH
jgi:4-hydroxy-tetrahydrodipicolinate synthase